MKGNISIGDFINQVKDELIESQKKSDNDFYELKEVNLEISFVLEASGGAKAKLLVAEFGGETTAEQTHRVSLRLEPLKKGGVSNIVDRIKTLLAGKGTRFNLPQ